METFNMMAQRPSDILVNCALFFTMNNKSDLSNLLGIVAFVFGWHKNGLIPIAYAAYILRAPIEHDPSIGLGMIDALSMSFFSAVAAWLMVVAKDVRFRSGGVPWAIAGAALVFSLVTGIFCYIESRIEESLEGSEELFRLSIFSICLGAGAGVNFREWHIACRFRNLWKWDHLVTYLRDGQGCGYYLLALCSATLLIPAAWVVLDYRVTHDAEFGLHYDQLDYRLFVCSLLLWSIGQISLMNLLSSVVDRASCLSVSIGLMSAMMTLPLKSSGKTYPLLMNALWVIFGSYVLWAAWSAGLCLVDRGHSSNTESDLTAEKTSREVEEATEASA